MKPREDKCNICLYVELSAEFVDSKCPRCGSEDVDDANFDPYEEEDENGFDL